MKKFKEFKELQDIAIENNVEFFSTPFDDQSLDFLNSIKVNINLYIFFLGLKFCKTSAVFSSERRRLLTMMAPQPERSW